jgi:aryl-alcohol dehydrogenase-like predicted oxidoreductase
VPPSISGRAAPAVTVRLLKATPADMRGLVEANLEGLGLDRLDVVYLRIGALEPPRGESLAERFEALREEGLIRHLGLSNVDTGHLAEARAIAPVAAVQNHAAQDEADLLAACEESGIAFVPFFPVGGHQSLDDERLAKVAARHGATAHGGQLWPGNLLAELATPTVAGLDRYGDTQLYVSRGAGAWGPPVRVGAPSDITVVELASKQT